jgi:N,N'-diacetyllegionaminate synthase
MSKKTFIVAEIGQAHDGSLGILHSYIDAVAQTGVDAIKFQTHIAEAESSLHEPFRVKFSYEDETRFDYWKRMEFTFDQWIGIKEHCEKVNVEFMSSPFSNAAVDLLEKLKVKQYKIGSGEVNNFLLLERIALTGKPVILSSGLSSLEELDKTVSFLKPKVKDLSILQCTTSYPTKAHQLGLNVIGLLKERYQLPAGLSDHSGEIYGLLAAAALSADILEFHAVFDKRMFGPDASSSLSIAQISELVKGVRFIDEAINHPINKFDNTEFKTLKSIFEKSLAVNRDLEEGAIITYGDLEAKKPKGQGIDAALYEQVIGKKIRKKKNKFEFLTWEDVLDVE